MSKYGTYLFTFKRKFSFGRNNSIVYLLGDGTKRVMEGNVGGGGRVNRERNMIELLMSLINKYKLNIAFGRLIQNYDFFFSNSSIMLSLSIMLSQHGRSLATHWLW
jgi:hypothetical protein